VTTQPSDWADGPWRVTRHGSEARPFFHVESDYAVDVTETGCRRVFRKHESAMKRANQLNSEKGATTYG